MRCRKSCCVPDHVNNTFKVLKNVRIPKSDNSITEFLQFVRSPLIIQKLLRFIVLPAIKLDHQLAIVACKIDDTCSNRNLTAKMAAFALEKPQLLPQLLFRISNVATKLTSQLVSHFPTPTPNPSPQGGGEKVLYLIPLPLVGRG